MYPAPITLTSLTCLSGTVLSTIMTGILDHKAASSWKLSWNITLLAPIYNGVVIFGITVYVQTLAIRKKGPVFMTSFRPLATIIVAITGLLILGDALYMGRFYLYQNGKTQAPSGWKQLHPNPKSSLEFACGVLLIFTVFT
ncbi:hypothetical protein F2P56_001177 [Juglans regia]|uniref:WAT1-related protein n=1 Tax=Juglans regia TaxID=51240 RepID=A0A834DAA1_JUGRE|nr:hypothetical protein F2P56_001177 [Juglans regia]